MEFHGYIYRLMKVFVADTLGFCKGVERAVSTAFSTLERAGKEKRKVYFYGQLVHNDWVCSRFSGKGAEVISSPGEAEEGSVVIIRAHGIPDGEREELLGKNIEIVDVTCPVVLKGQRLIRESEEPVLIFGYPGHSEVKSLLGSAKGPVSVVSSIEDLSRVEKGEYNGVVQTTFSEVLLKKLLEKAGEKGIIVNVLNHICTASVRRRESVMKLIPSVDGVVIVGDRHSANTAELASIVENAGKACFTVSSPEEIPDEVFSLDRVGVSAGASTPGDVYRRVIEVLED